MKTLWTKGLSESEKKQVTADFKSSAALRERLREMLSGKMEDQLKHARQEQKYSEPNWALHQADTCGYNRALAMVISLLEK